MYRYLWPSFEHPGRSLPSRPRHNTDPDQKLVIDGATDPGRPTFPLENGYRYLQILMHQLITYVHIFNGIQPQNIAF